MMDYRPSRYVAQKASDPINISDRSHYTYLKIQSKIFPKNPFFGCC